MDKTGGVKTVINTNGIKSKTPEELREEAYGLQASNSMSPAQLAEKSRKMQEIFNEMGYGFANISELTPHPDNDYSLDEEAIENLAASIRETKNTQPLGVRVLPDGTLQILTGERRWRAHQVLQARYGDSWGVVPIRNYGEISDEDAVFILNTDNLNQRTLTPTEKAKGFEIIAERISRQRKEDPEFGERYAGKKVTEIIAEQYGVSKRTVAYELAISRNLIEQGKSLLDENKITKMQAEQISRLDPAMQVEIAQRVAEGIDKEAISELIEDVKNGDVTEPSIKTHRPHAKDKNYYIKKARNALQKAVSEGGLPSNKLIGEVKDVLRALEAED